MSVFLYAIPLALFWMGITNLITLESFLVGYVLALLGSLLFKPNFKPANFRKLPGQIIALVIYVVSMYRDILLSGIDLAKRMLSRDMRLKPGIIAVSTQDPDKSQIVAALSGDVITLTPGELVVEIQDNSIMYIHCLNVDETEKHIAEVQARRLQLLLRILGR